MSFVDYRYRIFQLVTLLYIPGTKKKHIDTTLPYWYSKQKLNMEVILTKNYIKEDHLILLMQRWIHYHLSHSFFIYLLNRTLKNSVEQFRPYFNFLNVFFSYKTFFIYFIILLFCLFSRL